MKKLFLLGFFLVLACMQAVYAQERTVTGTVTSATDGTSLPGVNVSVKGTSGGTITDADGRYSIAVPGPNATLVFSFVGTVTQEALVGNQQVINVRLRDDVRQLSEVVVVGYGTIDRRDLTGSVTSISGEELANLPAPSFDQQLAGRAAGVQVTQPSGVLGQAPRVRIRGTNTITGGGEPLYVIDNVPVIAGEQSSVASTNPLANINPNDIESIEVLKDGAATAIYGSRAANGVVLITTRRGKAGRVNVNYDNFFGVNQVVQRLDLLNADQFVEIANEKFRNAGQPEQAVRRNGDFDVDTDWQDAIFRNGFVQNHNLSFSGGSEMTRYFFSLGFQDQQSALVRNAQDRVAFRSNIEHRFNRWINVGTNVSLSRTQTNGLNAGTNALSGNLIGAARMLPNVPIYDPNHPTGYHLNAAGNALGPGPNLRVIDNNFTNIAFVLDNNIYRANQYRIFGNVFAEATIVEGLSLRSQLATDILLNDDFQSLDPRHGDGQGVGGLVFRQFRPVNRWNWQNTLNINRSFGDDHRLNFVAGTEYQLTTFQHFNAQGRGFSDRFFQQQELISGTFATQLAGGTYVPTGFDSYFGRLNYSLFNRYLFQVTVRNDGISSLAAPNRRGTFPGASIGWRLNEEGFFRNTPFLAGFSDFKLRASYAVVGNVDIGAFPFLGTFGAAQYGTQTGIGFTNVGNPDLRWETSRKTNFGLDMTFLNDRVTVQADYFFNDVDNLVLQAPLPSSLGVPGNAININAGALTNQGVEFRLLTRNVNTENFRWTTDFNYTNVRNRVTSLVNDDDVIYDYNILRVGEPIGALYGFMYEGVNPANGNPIYRKGDGSLVQGNIATSQYRVYDPNNPGDITQPAILSASADRVVLGNTNPIWQGGMTNTFSFGGFDIELFLRYAGGHKIMNVTRQETLLNMGFQNNGTEILQRWTEAGQQTNVPRVWQGRENFINLTQATNSRFVENADFLRVQNFIVGYRLPQALLSRVGGEGIRQIRVFGQVQNALTFTRYSGLDPELNAPATQNANAEFGVDRNTNPILRTFTVGINLGL